MDSPRAGSEPLVFSDMVARQNNLCWYVEDRRVDPDLHPIGWEGIYPALYQAPLLITVLQYGPIKMCHLKRCMLELECASAGRLAG